MKEKYLKRNKENKCAISNSLMENYKEVVEMLYNDIKLKVKREYIHFQERSGD